MEVERWRGRSVCNWLICLKIAKIENGRGKKRDREEMEKSQRRRGERYIIGILFDISKRHGDHTPTWPV
jgi:hypothetical protein